MNSRNLPVKETGLQTTCCVFPFTCLGLEQIREGGCETMWGVRGGFLSGVTEMV